MEDLAQTAISLAIKGDWEKAKLVNRKILAQNPKDIDALNRLARSLAELGETPKAAEVSKKVLTIDPINSIALKSLDKWKLVRGGAENGVKTESFVPSFLEEPGKTKLLNLINLGDKKVVASLDCGERVELVVRPHRVCAVDKSGKYVGRLPDDLATHFKKTIRGGTHYEAFVKAVDRDGVELFIKETKNA